ncbi:MAG: hypothetical protein V2A58_01775 [Planctomycetota bacterium]
MPRRRSVLRERSSSFVELFRSTPTDTVCPNFYVLAHANGCSFAPGCSYCYLRSSFWYLKGPHVFTNVGRLLHDVSAWIARDDLESYVLNMGNLSDSLVFESVRPVVCRLVDLFRRQAHAKGRPHSLLLVTKGGARQCRPLYALEPSPSVIVSFSVNCPRAARLHEKGVAPVSDRLRAASDLKAKGWRVRVRIDPMILSFDYAWIAGAVKRLSPERVTLGTLRAEPHLLKTISDGLFSDLEPPLHRKALARYPKDLRLALYHPVVETLRSTCPIALCEETPDIWDALSLDRQSKPCNCGS